jgi:hypothetical protein
MRKKLNIFKKTTSIRKFNKFRKDVFLGLDDNKKKLYVWDYVKLTANMEVKSSWISRIYWNPVDGAFVDSHPTHIAMGISSGFRDLRQFLDENNKHDISHLFHETTETFIPRYSIKKVSYTDYLNWKVKKRKEKNEEENNSD